MSKKTETIEIRVSPEMKAALAETSAAADMTMSSYLRDMIAQTSAVGGASPKNSVGGTIMAHFIPRSFTNASLAVLPVALLAGIYVTGSGSGVTASPSYRMMFAEMDTDNNGQISAEEFEAFYGFEADLADDATWPEACTTLEETDDVELDFVGPQEEFALFDANRDAAVSYAELAGVLQRENVEFFLSLDANFDGTVTYEEALGAFAPAPEEEAALSAQEQACMDALAPLEADGDAEFFEETPEQAARMVIAEFDRNRDGVLSLAEVVTE